MELKEYIQIIKKHQALFWSIWLAFIITGIGILIFQPKKYTTDLSIDISREGGAKQEAQKEDFDQYYRLEADGSFSPQIVAWLSDPATLSEIKKKSKQKKLPKIKAEKLAPGFVQINFKVSDPKNSNHISMAIKTVLYKKVSLLEPDNERWFSLIFSGPVISKDTLPILPVLLGAITLGLFFSITGTLFKHYWSESTP